ncbi:MAG: DNA-binding protein WhiA, partial [Actinomycetales bacterium]
MPHMAMTAAVKDELSRVDVKKACCRQAELSALLRCSSALHLIAGQIVIEADLDAGSIARRVKREIFDLYGHESEIALVQPAGLRKSTRYLVRVVSGGDTLARQPVLEAEGGDGG